VKEQMGVKAVLKKIKENIPFWNEKLPEIPDLIYDYLKTGKEAQLQQVILLEKIQQQNQSNTQKIIYTILVGVCLISITILYR
jgi:ubiquinone biosynthesis protein